MEATNETRKERQERKRQDAVTRNATWNSFSPIMKLKILIDRGHGHCKQSVKLRKELGL